MEPALSFTYLLFLP